MQVFTVTVVETRTRRLRMAADHEGAARDAVEAVLRPGARVSDVQLYGDRVAASARAALDHLMARDFLMRDGVTLTVADWVRLAVDGDTDAQAKLALAGLRVEEGRLVIGSPTSVPALARWFRGTPWAKGELTAVLMLVPGAARSNRTFAGVGSRAVSLPLDQIELQEVAA